MKSQNIDEARIYKDELCTQCGSCEGICPSGAVKLIYSTDCDFKPCVSKDKCIHCGLCLKSCPGFSIDYPKLSSRLSKNSKNDKYLGDYINSNIAHTKIPLIKDKATSGGIITTLLIELLNNKKIDGAILVKNDLIDPLEPNIFVAKNQEEIISAMNSKYFSAPINSTLKKVNKMKGKYALVGLPCHIDGFMKISENVGRGNIFITMGLFCSFCLKRKATNFIISKNNIKLENVRKIHFREGKWPGDLVIYQKDGTISKINGQNHPSLISFMPERCSKCINLTNELADLSVGDAWLEDIIKKKEPTSLVITRTALGEKVFSESRNVKFEKIDPHRIIEAQIYMLNFKKNGFFIRKKFKKFTDIKYDFKPCFNIFDWIGNLLLTSSMMIINNKISFMFYKLIPEKFTSHYNRFIFFMVGNKRNIKKELKL